MVRSATSRVSNHEDVDAHPSRRDQEVAPQDEDRYTATNNATPITISAMPESSRPESGCLNE